MNVNNGTLDIVSAWRPDVTPKLNVSSEGGGRGDEHSHDDGGSNEENGDAAVLEGAGDFTLTNGGHPVVLLQKIDEDAPLR